jgi:hypothetical protein
MIKHYKILNLYQEFSFFLHLNKEYEMLTNLDIKKHLQNAIPKNKHLEIV